MVRCPSWEQETRGRYHGGRRLSSDDSFHSPTVVPPSALDKPSIVKWYHRRWTTRWGVTACLLMMGTLHDARFVMCRLWNDDWTIKTVITWWSSASIIPAPSGWTPLFSWTSHTIDLKTGRLAATLPHAKVSTRAGSLSVSQLWLGEAVHLIYSFCLSFEVCIIVWADPSLRCRLYEAGH